MKLHLPKALFTALLAACAAQTSWGADAWTTPEFEGPEFLWAGAAGDNKWETPGNWQGGVAPSRSNTYAGNDGDEGAVLLFDNVSVVVSNEALAGKHDTSDFGGIKVTGNSNVTCTLGRWGGAIYVEEGSSLSTSYSNNLKDSYAGNVANVYVGGALTITNSGVLNLSDGKTDQKWIIDTNGSINLSNATSVDKNGTWDLQYWVDDREVLNRAADERIVERTLISSGFDLSSAIDSVKVIDKTTGNAVDSGYTLTYGVNGGLSVSYTEYASASLEASGDVNWADRVAGWTVQGGDETNTTFLNGDTVRFTGDGTAALTGEVIVADLSVADGVDYTIEMASQSSLSIDAQQSNFVSNIKITSAEGDTSTSLHLNMAPDATGSGDGRIILKEGSSVGSIYTTGVVAYNLNNSAATSNLGGADLHLADDGVLLIRHGASGALDANIGDIYFDGATGILRVYGSVLEAQNASIADNITAVGELIKTDLGLINLTGRVQADAITSQGGTLVLGGTADTNQLTTDGGNITVSGTLNVNRGATLGTGTLTVKDTGTLKIAGTNASENAALLVGATGSGKLILAADATLNSPNSAAQATGNLTIEGATLTINLGRDDNHTCLSKFTSINLNDAVIKYHASNTTLNNVTVGEDGATFNIKDMGADRVVTFDGTTTLNGDFTIESRWNNDQTWKYGVQINGLTGTGDLTIAGTKSSGSPNEENKATVKLLDSYTGAISLVHGAGAKTQLTLTADGDINLTGLSISGGSKAHVDLSGVAGTKTLGTVSIGTGSTLNLQGAIGSMTVTGEGSLSLAAGTSISGSVSIGSALTIGGTLSNTGSVTLNSNVSYEGVVTQLKEAGTVTYSYNGTDGYASGDFYVVESSGSGQASVAEGLKLNGVYDLFEKNGSIVFTLINTSGMFHLNTIDFTADGSEGSEAKNATAYNIASGRTLTIAAGSGNATAAELLANSHGAGNVIVDTDITLSSGVATHVTGKLTINSGKTLTIGAGSLDESTIASFAGGVELAGGTLSFNGKGQEMSSLKVTKAGSLNMSNVGRAHQTFTINGITTLEDDLTVGSAVDMEHGTLRIKELTGSGDIFVSGGSNNNGWGEISMKVDKLTDYTGLISVDGEGHTQNINYVEFGSDAGAGFQTLKGLTVSNKAYSAVHGKGDTTIENLTLANEGVHKYHTYGTGSGNEGYSHSISKLTIEGSGTITTTDIAGGWQAEISIGELKNAEGSTSGELYITSGNVTSQRSIINLDGGDFAGLINVTASSTGSNRKLALNINSEDAAADAEIKLNGNGAKVALGVGYDTVNVKGISDAANASGTMSIVSGKQAYNTDAEFSSDDTVRTLAINTAGGNYSTSATVAKNLNIEKQGEGSQTFSGTVSSFNGSISALAGELAFTASDALSVSSLNVSNVGTLTVEKDSTRGTVTTSNATLAGGATVNANLTLNAGATLQMNGVTQVSAVALDGMLTLEKSGDSLITLTGTVLNTLAGLQAPGSGEVVLFTGVDSLVLGGQAYSVGPETLNTGSNVKLSDYFRNDRDIDFDKYYLAFNASTGDLTAGLIIPEPTTATLSLLALAGLCARRRRK